eukprot:4338488-Amphidinium_carterae.1
MLGYRELAPDAIPEHVTPRSNSEQCAEQNADNEEGYCCGCGMLGGRVWACRHHPELPRVGIEAVKGTSSTEMSGLVCYPCADTENE